MKRFLALPACLFLALLACLFLAGPALAQYVQRPADAVVRLESHGGSGTIIATGDGWTLILSCAHCFEGSARGKPISIDMPHPVPGPARKVGVKLIALGDTEVNDLALIRLNAGPVPYVNPVAPVGYRPGDCWSIGFDEMQLPAQCRPARIVGQFDANAFKTDTRPWHGRSGGGLIDKERGYTVGVCSAYTGPQNHAERMPGEYGVYASLPAIHRFLVQAGVMKAQLPEERFQPGPCPGGVCPVPRGPPSCPGGNCPCPPFACPGGCPQFGCPGCPRRTSWTRPTWTKEQP